ncbi:MAG: DivIVA domain-containing protein [Raineya sp.]|jgi:cell division initiation protein|nr:DivIVA domain-containing protein [Raineya sp.]
MKITPIEIRQKTFEKKAFGGYDKDEVTAFLQALSQEWEKLNNDLREIKLKLEMAEKEVGQLRQVESSLFKTLKTAEDTGSHIIEQAKKDAELKVKEAQLKADEILNDARLQSKNLVQKADVKAKSMLQQTLAEMKRIKGECSMLEDYKENLLSELKNISYSILDRVNRSESKSILDTFDSKIKETEAELEKQTEDFEQIAEKYKDELNQTENPKTDSNNNLASFFDSII